MSLNTNCYSMCFYKYRENIQFTYCINDIKLNPISSIKVLSVILTHNLNFQDHIEYVVKKSLRILGFVKRHSFDFKYLVSFKLFYCVLIRSILEYGSTTWSPYTTFNINCIKRVHNCFFKVYSFRIQYNNRPA